MTIADTANCGMTIRSGSSNSGGIYFSDATSGTGEYAGLIAYGHAGSDPNNFHIYTNSSERLRISQYGGIGIAGANYGSSGQVLTLSLIHI